VPSAFGRREERTLEEKAGEREYQATARKASTKIESLDRGKSGASPLPDWS
jgi:hypothetical protein